MCWAYESSFVSSCMDGMSCFRSGLLAYEAMGRMEVLLNSFVDVPSVIEMILRAFSCLLMVLPIFVKIPERCELSHLVI